MSVSVKAPTYLALEIGGTKLQLAIFDAELAIVDRFRFQVDRESGAAGIRDRICETLERLLSERPPSACGVGFGGPLDYENGRIARSNQIEGWSDFPLGSWLREITGVPVIVENDANTAALAEATKGAGAGSPHVFYVTLGSGVGGGCVVEGRLFHGAKPGESEIGLMLLDRRGATVESRCSGWAVDGRVRSLLEKGLMARPKEWPEGRTGQEARLLGPLIDAGDPTAESLLEEIAEDLAFGLSHVVHLLHPDIVVLGGGLSLIGEVLRAAVADKLPRFVTHAFRPGPIVKLSQLGEDVVLVGAALLAREALQES
jgi:glucokinase